MTEAEIRVQLSRYQWYHDIPLTPTIRTGGWSVVHRVVEMTLASLRELDLKGKRVLDIGCRDGIFAFEAEKRGARDVVAVDNDPSPGMREFLIPYFRSQVKLIEANLYDLRPSRHGKFDVIVFPGVLYHLRYPFWALKRVCDLLADDGILVLETGVFVDDNRHAFLYCPTGDDSPYEQTSCTFFNVKGLKDTLRSMGLTVEKVSLLDNRQPKHRPAWTLRNWLRSLIKGGPPPDTRVRTDRATFVCRVTPEVIDEAVTRYWHGTHRIHSAQRGRIHRVAV
jgi:SAM-dependent methyltransferase